ncbi:GNAT family N-acetyltransferase [Streptomyces sp. NPDC047821]|uniref:GNAT family N-acetyltransferase n=1 Tax=Streptomyces sp. NPDC047821 TaxID=3365488 RepID=UPI003717EA36
MSSIPVPVGRGVVRRASRADTDELAALLAGAFLDDPLTRWITPDTRRRERVLPGFFRVFLDLSFAYDGVLTDEDRDAVLLFLPPGAWEETEARGDELHQRFAAVLGDDAGALAAVGALQARHHPAGRPHYYVSFGAVRPSAQRGGLMTALLEHLVARADAAACGTYAEASSPGGEAACRRLGFGRFGGDIALPDGGPVLRPMWRDAR